MIIFRSVLLKMRNVSYKSVEKMKTQILYSISIFRNRAVYEIVWKNILEPDRPQMTICACALHAGYLMLHTHSHSQYVKLTAFPLQQWLHEFASMLHCTYVVYLLNFHALFPSSLCVLQFSLNPFVRFILHFLSSHIQLICPSLVHF